MNNRGGTFEKVPPHPFETFRTENGLCLAAQPISFIGFDYYLLKSFFFVITTTAPVTSTNVITNTIVIVLFDV